MSVLKISSTIVGSEINGYYAAKGFCSDPKRRRQFVWESDNDLRLEADDDALFRARIIRGRSVLAERQATHWDVWNGAAWKTDKEFRVLHHLHPSNTALQVKPPILQYHGSTVFFLAFTVRPSLIEESIAVALDIHPKHVAMLHESDKVPYFAIIQIVGTQQIVAKKYACELARQFGDIHSSIWNTPFAESLIRDDGKKGLHEVSDMPHGAPPGPVENAVAHVYRDYIKISWTTPRGDGGHCIQKYGVQVVGQSGYCHLTTETSCNVPKEDIEPFLPKGPACWLGRPLAVAAINTKGASVLKLAQLNVVDATGWEFGGKYQRSKRLAARARVLDELATHNEAIMQKVNREKAALRALWELDCEGEQRARQVMERRAKLGDPVNEAQRDRDTMKAEKRRRKVVLKAREDRRDELFGVSSDEGGGNDEKTERSITQGASSGTITVPSYFCSALVSNHIGSHPSQPVSSPDVPPLPEQQLSVVGVASRSRAKAPPTALMNGRAAKHTSVLYAPQGAHSCPKSRANDDNAPKAFEHPQLHRPSDIRSYRSVEAKGAPLHPKHLDIMEPGTRVVDSNGWQCRLKSRQGDLGEVTYDDGSTASIPMSELKSIEKHHCAAEMIQRLARRALRAGICGGT